MKKNNENKRKDTKKLVVIVMIMLVAITLCGCKKDKKPDVIIDDEPVVTAEPTVEVTPAPTEEPTTEATPAPTEEPTPAPTENPYPGIDMESELPGLDWIQSFNGVVDEAKVIVFNDETGRKQIIEEQEKVLITHESDVIAVHLPEGYIYTGTRMGFDITEMRAGESYIIFDLDFEKMQENKFIMAGVEIKHDGEANMFEFTIQTQE